MAAAAKCFLVTGALRVGKTTLISRVLEALKHSHPSLKIQGFYSREIREGAGKVGFEVLTVDGRRGPLASANVDRMSQMAQCGELRPNVGNYKVFVLSFESLALPELQVKEDTDLFIIDEIGKMKLFSSSFLPAVLRILKSRIPLLATIPVRKDGREIPRVARLKNHPEATIYMLNTTNRDAMRERIYSNLLDLLQNR